MRVGDARLLQTSGGPDRPRISRIEATGEYPLIRLRFHDPALPVNVELLAFSPFEPMNTRLSSMPLAAFVFKLTDPGQRPQTVSLAAFLQNPVGYDAAEEPTGRAWSRPETGEAERLRTNAHPKYGSNVNEPFLSHEATGLIFRAQAGHEPTLDRAVTIYASDNLRLLNAPPPDRPPNLNLNWLEQLSSRPPDADPSRIILWLEEAAPEISEVLLRRVRDAVRAGGTLVLSGRKLPLLDAYGVWSQGRPWPK